MNRQESILAVIRLPQTQEIMYRVFGVLQLHVKFEHF
jgi:hypothetical protein